MPSPKDHPNLTRAGKGQPRKSYGKILLSLPPETIAAIDALAKEWDCYRNEAVIRIVEAIAHASGD
jgi:hypothetical protein